MRSGPNPAKPLADLLQDLSAVIQALSDEDYCAVPADGMSGSIGGQARHCLDHVGALIRSAETGMVSYDDRARGTQVETDRGAALACIRELQDALAALSSETLGRRLRLTVLVTPRDKLTTESTFARELAFVLSHTTHHHALIAWLLRELGAAAPAGFGVAPATAAHLLAAAGHQPTDGTRMASDRESSGALGEW